MKTATKKSFLIFSLFVFLTFGVNSFAVDIADHDVLASQFENLAQEMQAKAAEYLEQAAYHHAIAEQTGTKSVVEQKQINSKTSS